MALRSDWSNRPCPIARSTDVIGDPWTLLVLREVLYGVRRFEEIRDNLEVTDKTLADRLSTMVANGLLRREKYSGGSRVWFEYVPTQSAEEALPVLHALARWGERNRGGNGGDRSILITCTSCGQTSLGLGHCEHCGTETRVTTVAWVRPTTPDRRPHPLGTPAGRVPPV